MKPTRLHLCLAAVFMLSAGCRDATSPEPEGWKDVAAFAAHTCGLTRSGAVYCWGEGYGRGVGVPFAGFTATSLIQNRCARDANDAVHCWGGSLGAAPVQVTRGTVKSFSRGTAVMCAIGADGIVRCSGENLHGELGNGTSGASRPVMAPVLGGHQFASVVAKFWAICGLDSGGKALCWGWNYMAGLGRRTTETCPVANFADPCSTTPGAVSGNLTFRAIDVAGGHACGIAKDGRLYCWGADAFQALGTGVATDRCTPNNIACTYTPVPVGTRTDYRSIHTSGVFSCGLTEAGEAHCWGSNYSGQLGDGVSNASGIGTSRREAGPVTGGHRFTKISLGEGHGCGLTAEGKLYCWGSNEVGELGVGRAPNSNRPVEVKLPA